MSSYVNLFCCNLYLLRFVSRCRCVLLLLRGDNVDGNGRTKAIYLAYIFFIYVVLKPFFVVFDKVFYRTIFVK